MVQKVVAIGIFFAWRNVLNCIEAIKFTATWQICGGALSGTKPSANIHAISNATNAVSQRTILRRFICLGKNSEMTVPSR